MTGIKKKNLIPLGLTLLVGGVFLVPEVFANSVNTNTLSCNTSVNERINIFYMIQGLFSWVWLILANIVGKLMTNSFLYGEALNLDVYLWKIWQISRNIANFAIGFYFLYVLLKYLISPSEKETPMKIIKNLLLSSVLVQASWFLIMVVIDISMVIFAMVSSFPSQILAKDVVVANGVYSSFQSCADANNEDRGNVLCKWKDSVVTFTNNPDKDQLFSSFSSMIQVDQGTGALTENQMLDNLLPKPDSLSGPLMFIGFEIFRTAHLSEYSASGVSCSDATLKSLIQVLLYSGSMIMYTISLLILAVVLIMRAVYIWIFIALSPIAIVLYFLKLFKIKDGFEFLNRSTMVNLIFQPVFYAFYIGLMFVVLAVINWIFKAGVLTKAGPLQIEETLNSSTMSVGDGLLNVIFTNTTMGIHDLLIGVIGLVLMWILVKAAVSQKTGISTIDKFTKSTTDMLQSAVDTMPLIPLPGKGTSIGIGSLYDGTTNTSPFLDVKYDQMRNELVRQESEQNSVMKNLFGVYEASQKLTEESRKELKIDHLGNDVTKYVENYKAKITSLRKAKNTILFDDVIGSLSPLLIKEYKEQWKPYINNVEELDKDPKSEKDLITFLNKTQSWKKLYKNLFGVDEKNIPEIFDKNKEHYTLPPL